MNLLLAPIFFSVKLSDVCSYLGLYELACVLWLFFFHRCMSNGFVTSHLYYVKE